MNNIEIHRDQLNAGFPLKAEILSGEYKGFIGVLESRSD
jgi:hypothetical protein